MSPLVGLSVCLSVCPSVCLSVPRYPTNGTIFGKNVTENKISGFIFCTNLSAMLLIARKTERDIIINSHRSSSKVPHKSVRFSWKLNLLNKFFKSTYVKFNENPSSGIRVVLCGRRAVRTCRELYGHAEANNRFSQFREKRLERIVSNTELTNSKAIKVVYVQVQTQLVYQLRELCC
jgi:hypothetical protein